MPIAPFSCVTESYCFSESSGNVTIFSQHVVNHTPCESSRITEEKNFVRETETLVAPTRYAVVAIDEEKGSLRGDRSRLSSGESPFNVAHSKGNQSDSARLIVTQESGYCTQTATQEEVTYLSHNGKQAYRRVPCGPHTPLNIRPSGAKGTLTDAIDELAIEERGTKDKTASEDDSDSSVSLRRSGTEQNMVGTRKQRAGTLSPQQSQAQSNSSHSASPQFFCTDYNMAAPLGSLSAGTHHKDRDTAPVETPPSSKDKQHVAVPQCGRAEEGVASPFAPNHGLARIRSDSDPNPHLVMSVQATADDGVYHPTDLVVTVVQLPKTMARSMTVTLQTPR